MADRIEAMEMLAQAKQLRRLAGQGIKRVTTNGNTTEFESVDKMLDAADRLEGLASRDLGRAPQSFLGSTRMIYRRR